MDKQININEKIPHRYPFTFVDKVVDYRKNEWIVGTKTISRNDRYPLAVSPVLICEALAQLSKILETLSSQGMESISYLANMQIDFFESPEIGDCLELYAQAGKKIGELVSYNIEAKVRSNVIL